MKLLPDNMNAQHKKLIYALGALLLVWVILFIVYRKQF
jgi:hypothetical protein